jgi:hypothetical protein
MSGWVAVCGVLSFLYFAMLELEARCSPLVSVFVHSTRASCIIEHEMPLFG